MVILLPIILHTKIEDIVDSIQSMPGIAFIATHQNTNPYELFFHQALKK